MNEHIKNYFSDNILNESLVIFYQFERQDSSVTLVFEYAYEILETVLSVQKVLKRPKYDKDVRKLVFQSVEHYSWSPSYHKRLANFSPMYVAENNTFSATIQGTNCQQISHDQFYMQIDFGSVGVASFNFEDLSSDRRLIMNEGKRDGRWIYRDVIDHEIVDFYKPFNLS